MKIKNILYETLYGIVPISIIITILQFTILRMPIEMYIEFLVGTVLVIIGLFLFLVGIETSFVPAGESLGNSLVKSGRLRLIVLFGFLVGFATTLPEPDVHVFIRQTGAVISSVNAITLLIVIAIGVGVFASIAFLRIFLSINIKYILLLGYFIVFGLLIFCPDDFRSIAFDVGGVTTGSLSVPFIMALGLGVSAMISPKENVADGFGILAIASVGPIIATLLMGVIIG